MKIEHQKLSSSSSRFRGNTVKTPYVKKTSKLFIHTDDKLDPRNLEVKI